MATIGLASKVFLNSGYCSSVRVNGIHSLLNELSRKDGRGVITGVFVLFLKFFLILLGDPSVESSLNVRHWKYVPTIETLVSYAG